MVQRLKLFSLLAINLKDKSFRMDGLYLQVNIPPWLEKFSDLQCSNYWKKHFVKLLLPWYVLAISLHM